VHGKHRKGSALPTDPTERGGPPPLVGLSPGLCGPGWSVTYFTHRTVTLQSPCRAVNLSPVTRAGAHESGRAVGAGTRDRKG